MDKSTDQNIFADKPTPTILPDPVFEKVGITAQFTGINRLGVHTYKKPTLKEDVESQFAGTEAKVYQLRTDSILFDPIIRKLVNESCGTFIAGQSPGGRPETLKLSRQYRSIIRACIEDLQTEFGKSSNKLYQQYVTIFYNVEFIWHLTEILFVNALPEVENLSQELLGSAGEPAAQWEGGETNWQRCAQYALREPNCDDKHTAPSGDIVLPHLLEWVRFHFPTGELGAAQILGGVLEPGAEARHPEYWPTVITLILQGSLEPARALLRLHSQADADHFLEAEKMLKTLPVYNVFGGLSVSDFNNRFNAWQATLATKLEEGVFAPSKNLQLIMKMIGGQSVSDMKKHCGTWYELMVAALLYTEPTVKSFDLNFHANKCIMQYGGPPVLKLLDHIVLSLLECNLHDVIKKLQLTCDSGWAASHLTNLLFHCGRLNVIDNKLISGMPARLDEELVAEYGSLLMSHRSLWQAGLNYLDQCPALGRPRLQLLLPRLALHTRTRALKIIQAALDRDMPEVAASVCKVEGMRSLRQKRLGQALSWALQSQDPGFATFLSDKVLEAYAREGVFDSQDLLDNLGSCMLMCDRLTFLGKYCEFHQVYQNGDLKKAAGLLVSLLASKICPKYFWLTLLTDALPLLECQDTPVFSYRDTCELVSCLEELGMEATDHPRPHPSPTPVPAHDKHRLIRLALTKNLARALVHEASLAP